MTTSAEKLVKQTIKLLSKTQDLNYEELKHDAKKLIKAARNFDDSVLGIMEEIMDLSNISSEEELEEFDIEVIKIYCKIKGLEDTGSDKSLRGRAWRNMEEEFELASDDDDEELSDDDDEEPEGLLAVPADYKPPPEVLPVKTKKSKKSVVRHQNELVIG